MTIGRPRIWAGYPTPRASCIRFLFVGSEFCHQLPSDPTSRWAPLPRLVVPVIAAHRGLAPPSLTTCLAHQIAGSAPLRCAGKLPADVTVPGPALPTARNDRAGNPAGTHAAHHASSLPPALEGAQSRWRGGPGGPPRRTGRGRAAGAPPP